MSQTEMKPQPAAKGAGMRIAGIVVGLVFLMIGALQFFGGVGKLTGGASDSGIAADAKEAKAAADKLGAQATQAYKSGKPPRQTDAAVAPLLDKVFDTAGLRSKKPKVDDVGPLSDWLLANIRTGALYIFAGTGVEDFAKVPNDPKILAQADKNVVAFAPETGRYIDASVDLTAALADAIAPRGDAASDNEKVKAGKAKMRAGMTTTIASTLQTVTIDGLSDDWRRARLDVLDAAAPKLAGSLDAAQCKQLHDTAAQASAALKDEGVKKGLDTFNAALKC